MKFILTIIGLLISAGYVRAEITFYSFLKENKSNIREFKIKSKEVVLQKEELKSFYNKFIPSLKMKQTNNKKRPLPSAKDFEAKVNTYTSEVSLTKNIWQSGTVIDAYYGLTKSKNRGEVPSFGQVNKPFANIKGIKLTQQLLRNSFGSNSRLNEKVHFLNQKVFSQKSELEKSQHITLIAHYYSKLVLLKKISLIMKSKCNISKKNFNISKKKKAKNLISEFELRIVALHFRQCENELENLNLNTSHTIQDLQFFFSVKLNTDFEFNLTLPTKSSKDSTSLLKSIINLEKSKNKYNLQQTLNNARNDLSLAFEINSFGEGKSRSWNYKEKSNEFKVVLSLTIPLGESIDKQLPREVRIRNSIEDLRNKNLIDKDDLSRVQIKTKLNSLIMMHERNLTQLYKTEKVYKVALAKFKKGQLNYKQISDLSDDYFNIKIQIQHEKSEIFIHKVKILEKSNHHLEMII